MRSPHWFVTRCLAGLIAGVVPCTAGAQEPGAPSPLPALSPPAPAPGADGFGLPPSRPQAVLEGTSGPAAGPTPPEDLRLLRSLLPDHPGVSRLADERYRLFGWLNMGYTTSSSGSGPLSVQPRENRFGNEFLLNQLAVVVERGLDPDALSFGFRSELYAGADAALLHPLGGIPADNPRFGLDFRQLYASAHLPVLTEGGVDLKVGRQYTLIGYESAMAPYRPFYSNSYQWFYSQDGAFTGLTANWHVTKQLDVISGLTLGANTFFTLRGDAPCYIGQVNYWLQEEKRTQLSGTVLTGPGAVFGATPELTNQMTTVVELRALHHWSRFFTQIVQADMGWADTPGGGTAAWYSLMGIGIAHVSETVDLNVRGEWFDDSDGSRIGIPGHYGAVTLGLNCMPRKWLNFRPEVRGDFADTPAFGPPGSRLDRSQLTAAVECLIKF